MMSDCCISSHESKSKTQKRECPACHQVALNVTKRTILQHIKKVWCYEFSDNQYFFCRTEDCDVVYFSEKDETINKAGIRTLIGIKEQDDNALICYCFGVNKAVASTDKRAKDFVVEQAKESTCTCETNNPSGRCCLKDFPKSK